MRYIILLAIVVACTPTDSTTKHSNFSQDRNRLASWHANRKILIKIVHKDKWRIGIKYDKDTNFTPDQKKELEIAIEESLMVWLAPVRKHCKKHNGKDVIAKFEFVEIKPTRFHRYQRRKAKVPIDLEITFKKGWGRSHWRARLTDGLGMVRMFRGHRDNQRRYASGDNEIPQNASGYSWNTLLHELGHAFGLADTYPKEGKRKSTGGSDKTSGKHPESIMSGQLPKDRRVGLTYDDIVGIYGLYRLHVEGLGNKKECFSPEFKWDEGSKGCIPKYPVIFAAKYGNKFILSRLLLDDPDVDINETDPLGNTALHAAIEHRGDDAKKVEKVVMHLLLEQINVNATNHKGQTPLHMLVANGYTDESEFILSSLLNFAANTKARDSHGKTPYDYAEEHNAKLTDEDLEDRFPKAFLDHLNPANSPH